MTESLIALLAGILPSWRVFFLSAIPIAELRVSIPLGLAWGLNPVENLLYAILGNMLPVIPLLLLLKPVIKILSRIPFFKVVIDKILARTRRHSDKIEKFGVIGLAFFVGIPAPGTGAWTGTLLAFLFGINFWQAFSSIAAGVVAAGAIVTVASLGIWQLAKNGIGYLVVALVIVIFAIWYNKRRK